VLIVPISILPAVSIRPKYSNTSCVHQLTVSIDIENPELQKECHCSTQMASICPRWTGMLALTVCTYDPDIEPGTPLTCRQSTLVVFSPVQLYVHSHPLSLANYNLITTYIIIHIY